MFVWKGKWEMKERQVGLNGLRYGENKDGPWAMEGCEGDGDWLDEGGEG